MVQRDPPWTHLAKCSQLLLVPERQPPQPALVPSAKAEEGRDHPLSARRRQPSSCGGRGGRRNPGTRGNAGMGMNAHPSVKATVPRGTRGRRASHRARCMKASTGNYPFPRDCQVRLGRCYGRFHIPQPCRPGQVQQRSTCAGKQVSGRDQAPVACCRAANGASSRWGHPPTC